jgi:hypothetical protein
MAFGDNKWRAHAELIGQVTLSWNYAVHQLLRVFSHLTGLPDELCEAIFFSHQSDKSQRTLLARVAAAVDLPEKDRAALQALLQRLDKVSPTRNLAAHTIFGMSAFDPDTSRWEPTVVAVKSTDHRLQKDFTAQFKQADTALRAIYKDLDDWLTHTPIPDRPWGAPPFLGYVPTNMADLESEAEPSASEGLFTART